MYFKWNVPSKRKKEKSGGGGRDSRVSGGNHKNVYW